MFFFFNDTATTEIYTLSLHDALPILGNSASSSKNNTPLLARLISPRDEFAPPPIIEILVVVWCGCLKGLVFTKDRKSTRLNSSHANISYAVFCLKKKKIINTCIL